MRQAVLLAAGLDARSWRLDWPQGAHDLMAHNNRPGHEDLDDPTPRSLLITAERSRA